RNVPMTFGPNPAVPVLAMVASDAEPDPSVFQSPWVRDWKSIVADKAIDLVAIASAAAGRAPIAVAAIAAGKHVYCDQPVATSAADTEKVLKAAETGGVVPAVSFPYLSNPAQTLARRLIADGKTGAT